MSKWPLRKLGDDEICILNPKKAEVAGLANDTPVSFVPMARVDEISGTMNVSESKNLGDEPVAKPILNQIIHSLKYGTIKKL